MTRSEILALPAQTNTRLLQASDTNEVFSIEVGDTGAQAKILFTPVTILTESTDVEIPMPSGSFAAGARALFHVTSTSGGGLTTGVGIHIPSDSTIAFPKPLTATKTTIVQLNYVGGQWGLTTIVGEF